MQWNNNWHDNRNQSSEISSEFISRKLPWKRFRNFTYQFAVARLNKLTMLTGLLIACLFIFLSLFIVLSWYQPVETQRWTIITEKYTQNLVVDHTVAAARSGQLIGELLKSGGKNAISAETFGIFPENETEIRHLIEFKPQNLEKTTIDSSCKSLIYQFYCHGLSDEKGPYLLIDWLAGGKGERIDPPKESDKIRIKELLQSLVNLAKGRPIAVFFDTEHSLEFQHLGVTDNQFAEKLIELEPWIESIPNLTVISSTSNDQISEIDDFEGESLFGKFIRKNMNFSSRLGPSFTLTDLFEETRDQVSFEAQNVYHVQQRPVLLPFGSIGKKRAGEIRIRAVGDAAQGTPYAQSISQKPSDGFNQNKSLLNTVNKSESIFDSSISAIQKSELNNIWETYSRISKIKPAPYWNFPSKWKVYKAAISRYEQLILIGELSEANTIYPSIQRLSVELEQPIILPRNLINGTMSLLEKYYFYTNKYQPEWLESEFEKAWADRDVNIEKPILKFVGLLDQLPPIIRSEYQKPMPGNVKDIKAIIISGEVNKDTEKRSETINKDESGNTQPNPSILERLGISKSEMTKESNIQFQKADDIQTNSDLTIDKKEKDDTEKQKSSNLDSINNQEAESRLNKVLDASSNSNNISSLKTKNEKMYESNPDLILNMPPYHRYWIYQLLLNKLQTYDSIVFQKAVEWMRIIKPVNENLPIELHLIGLINKDLKTLGFEFKSKNQESALNDLIRCCLIFSRAANNHDDPTNLRYIFFNHAFFWFYPEITKADETFARGWDRFFSLNQNERENSIQDFEQANILYTKIMKDSTEIQKNIEYYISALESLHELGSWIAFDIINYDESSSIKSELLSVRQLVRNGWDCINNFTALSKYEGNYDLDQVRKYEILSKISIGGQKINEYHTQLIKNYQIRVDRILTRTNSSSNDMRDMRAIRHAIKITSSNLSLKPKLLEAYFNLKSKINRQMPETYIKQPSEISSLNSLYLRVNSEFTRWMYQSIINNSSSLSSNLTFDLSNPLMTSNLDSINQNYTTEFYIDLLVQELNKFNTEPDLLNEIPDFAKLWETERFLRLGPLSLIGDVKDRLTRIHIIKSNSEHLRLSAKRLWEMHWGSLEENSTPYFKKLGEICLQYAENTNREQNIKSDLIKSLFNEYQVSPIPSITTRNIHLVGGNPTIQIPFEMLPSPSTTKLNGSGTLWLKGNEIVKSTSNSFKSVKFPNIEKNGILSLSDIVWSSFEQTSNRDLNFYQSFVSINLLYRGNHFQNSTQIKLYRGPSWTDYRPVPPPGGSISVNADDSIIEKYGKSGGSVCFVLDCSGSMGIPNGYSWSDSAKYSQAVKSVLETIRLLPKDTEISIWVFGESVGESRNAKDVDTIRRVVNKIKWDSEDISILEEIKNRISYPNCIPWNRSPVIETMRLASLDLLGSRSPRMMIVITDGQDTGIDNNESIKSNNPLQGSTLKNNLISDKIRSIFTDTDISVNVLGFRLAKEESQSVQSQFAVVRDLPTPGIYSMINTESELSRSINSVLTTKLLYRIYPEENNSIREEAVKGVEIQLSGVSDRWINPLLLPGNYKIWSDVGHRISNRISIRDGHRLLLQMTEDKSDSVSFSKRNWLRSSFGFRPSVSQNEWRMTWIASKVIKDELRILLGIECEKIDVSDGVLEMQDLGDWNIILTSNQRKDELLNGSIERLWNYQANTWEVKVKDFSNEHENPSIKLEMQLSRKFTPEAVLRRPIDFNNIKDLENKKITLPIGDIIISSVELQERYVPDRIDRQKLVSKKCYVLKTQSLPGIRVRGDLQFNQNDKMDRIYKYYDLTGTSETVIWLSDGNSNNIQLSEPNSVLFTISNSQSNTTNGRIVMKLGEKDRIPLTASFWPEPVNLKYISELKEKRDEGKSDTQKSSLFPPAIIPDVIEINSENN